MRMAIAPRPQLQTIEHYSPEFNAWAEQLRASYNLLGAPKSFVTEEAPDPHDMTLKLRLATADWFCRWFYNRPGPAAEADISPEPARNLYCTPDGSLRYSQQGDTIFSFILKSRQRFRRIESFPTLARRLSPFSARQRLRFASCFAFESPTARWECGVWSPRRAGVITLRSWNFFPKREYTPPPGSSCRSRPRPARPPSFMWTRLARKRKGWSSGSSRNSPAMVCAWFR